MKARTLLTPLWILILVTSGCGSSDPPCSDTCQSGAYHCVAGQDAYQICGDHDSDGCLEWGDAIGCAAGEVCIDGACEPGSGGFVLSGGLLPASGSSTGMGDAEGLRLHGVVVTGFQNGTSRSGELLLEHGGLGAR